MHLCGKNDQRQSAGGCVPVALVCDWRRGHWILRSLGSCIHFLTVAPLHRCGHGPLLIRSARRHDVVVENLSYVFRSTVYVFRSTVYEMQRSTVVET